MHGARAQVIGLTGPPGVGKSTLIARLIEALRAEDRSVGVIAIDPSSRRSGGALLGDRVRLALDAEDPGVFVRSMAARGRLGGLAAEAFAATLLMRAVYDRVIVETVGVGQSETDIAIVADTVVLCVQPGSGDSLQYIKAGIAEIPDIAVIGKADLGSIALKAQSDLEAALALERRDRRLVGPDHPGERRQDARRRRADAGDCRPRRAIWRARAGWRQGAGRRPSAGSPRRCEASSAPAASSGRSGQGASDLAPGQGPFCVLRGLIGLLEPPAAR